LKRDLPGISALRQSFVSHIGAIALLLMDEYLRIAGCSKLEAGAMCGFRAQGETNGNPDAGMALSLSSTGSYGALAAFEVQR
jgi:hypothetical protein